MQVKRGDTVVITAGKDRGKKGKILATVANENRVIVEGINMVTKHKKPQGPTSPGGRMEMEGPIDASNVMYFCEKDKTGVRIGHKFLEDGSKVRVCKKCGEEID